MSTGASSLLSAGPKLELNSRSASILRSSIKKKYVVASARGARGGKKITLLRQPSALCCSCFRFEGRLVGTDLVGEKIDPVLASEILVELNRLKLGLCVSLLTKLPKHRHIDRPSYLVLAQWGMRSEIAKTAEELLLRCHPYQLAHELGRLGSADALVEDNAVKYFEEVIRPSARIEGSTKVEALALWDATS